jgi:hypothetical protein
MSTQTFLSGPVMDMFLISAWRELIVSFSKAPTIGQRESATPGPAGRHSESRQPPAGASVLDFRLSTALLTGEAPDANIGFDPFYCKHFSPQWGVIYRTYGHLCSHYQSNCKFYFLVPFLRFDWQFWDGLW